MSRAALSMGGFGMREIPLTLCESRLKLDQ